MAEPPLTLPVNWVSQFWMPIGEVRPVLVSLMTSVPAPVLWPRTLLRSIEGLEVAMPVLTEMLKLGAPPLKVITPVAALRSPAPLSATVVPSTIRMSAALAGAAANARMPARADVARRAFIRSSLQLLALPRRGTSWL